MFTFALWLQRNDWTVTSHLVSSICLRTEYSFVSASFTLSSDAHCSMVRGWVTSPGPMEPSGALATASFVCGEWSMANDPTHAICVKLSVLSAVHCEFTVILKTLAVWVSCTKLLVGRHTYSVSMYIPQRFPTIGEQF